MLLIDCPYCGPRDEAEFNCGGEAHIARPLAENEITDAEFGEYLFLRDNPKGVFTERWVHSAGCRRWFNAVRDTLSHEFIEIYPMGSTPASPAGKSAYDNSWRRQTAAEAASKPAGSVKKAAKKAAAKKPVAKKAAPKKAGPKKAAAKKA